MSTPRQIPDGGDDDARRRRVANALGAVALAIVDRLVGTDGLGALPAALNQPSSAAAVALVTAFPGIPLPRLEQGLCLSQPATVRVVDRLEDAGLVERRRRPGVRQVEVHPTAAGRRAGRRLGVVRAGALDPLVASLTDREQTVLLKLLQRLGDELVADAEDLYRVCRLCDVNGCGGEDCPLHVDG